MPVFVSSERMMPRSRPLLTTQREGLPSRCVVSNGLERGIILSDETNTGIVRYSIQCRGAVSVAVVADGAELDPSYVYLVRDSSGTEKTGIIAANDTVS